MPYPWDTTGLVPTKIARPGPFGSHTGFSIGTPLTSSAATRTGALSTVTAVRKERLPIDGSHWLAAIWPAESYASPVAK